MGVSVMAFKVGFTMGVSTANIWSSVVHRQLTVKTRKLKCICKATWGITRAAVVKSLVQYLGKKQSLLPNCNQSVSFRQQTESLLFVVLIRDVHNVILCTSGSN